MHRRHRQAGCVDSGRAAHDLRQEERDHRRPGPAAGGRGQLRRSGLAFTVYDGPPYTAEPAETLAPPQTFPSTCDYVLTYSGTMWWDLAMYLNHAEFRIQDRSYREVGFATWHLKGHGGFDLGKYSSTDSKVAPVLAELLGGVPS